MASRTVAYEGTFSDDPTFDTLLSVLVDLACEWRTTKSNDTVKRYQSILKSLIDMGWNDNLDIEGLLPTELMPVEYKDRNKVKTHR